MLPNVRIHLGSVHQGSNPETQNFLTTSTQHQVPPKVVHYTRTSSCNQGAVIYPQERTRTHTARTPMRVLRGIDMKETSEPTSMDDQDVKLKLVSSRKLRIGTRSKVKQFIDETNEKLKSLVELEEER